MTSEHSQAHRQSTSVKGLYRLAKDSDFFIREFRTRDGLYVAVVGDRSTLQELGIKSTTRLDKIPSPSASALAGKRVDAVRTALDAWRRSKVEPQSTED
jgi:hypothetical protein